MNRRLGIAIAVVGILAVPPIGLIVVRPAIAAQRQARYSLDPSAIPPGEQGVVAFVDVTVIPMEEERALEHQTVLVEGSVIAEVGPAEHVTVPEQAIVIDAAGKYLVPGLSDMHVHLRDSENNLLLYLANGVTSVRELGGTPLHLGWRDEIEAGERPGPNLVVYTSKLASTDRHDRAGLDREIRFKGLLQIVRALTPGATHLHPALGIPSVLIDDPARADQIVTALQTDGYDGLKTGSYLSAEAHRAIVASARAHGFPVDGHIPYSIDYQGFLDTGQQATAHVEELFKILLDEFPDHYDLDGPADVDRYFEGLEQQAFPRMAQATAEQPLWVTTTLVAMQSFAQQAYHLDQVLARPEVEYINPIQLDAWQPDRNRYVRDPESPHRDMMQRWGDGYFSYQVSLARQLHEAGAPLLAGTDSVIRGVFPGFSLHEELEILVGAGLTPYEALQTATVNPAIFLGRAGEFGTVEVGKRADLVLLDANPLQEINATRQIAGVMVRGTWYSAVDLEVILEAIAEAHR